MHVRTNSTDIEKHELPAPEIEDKVLELTRFGLTPLQAKVYIRLVMLGPSHARSLGNLMRINRVDTYRILRELKKRGIVEVLLTEPSKFVAVDPAKAIETLIQERERSVKELRRQSSDIHYWLSSISNIESDICDTENSRVAHFKLKYGKQMLATLQRLVQGSKNEILKIWSAPGLSLHVSQGLLDDFIDAAKRGVKIRGITEITPVNRDEVLFLSRYVELKHNKQLSSALRYTVIDRKQVLINATSAPLQEKELVAFWTDNDSLVNGLTQDFERLWRNSLAISEKYGN